jgi:hypothetical protein
MKMRAIITLLIWLLPSATFAQAKFALLIGNQAYDASVGVLKNSHNDIAVVGETLRAQNFDVLPPIKDARRSAILGLKFIAWGGAWKYEFKVMPDGSMTGQNQGPPPHAGSRIALARVAAGTPLEPSTANPFDGIWDIVRHGTNCGSANTYTAVLIIENGIVFGEMGAGEVQGSVRPSGTFRLTHPSVSGGPGATQMHSGRLEGARGSGTFHHSSNSCKGTFTMNRR